VLQAGESTEHSLAEGRIAWIQVARGSVLVNGQTLKAGDGLSATSSGVLRLEGVENAEVLLFDMVP
jgi:quercetin 2,3-dioxygenase